MEYLPYHVQFKILEQLNFSDLLSLKKTCNYFNYLIEQNKKKLAKKEFKNINIIELKKEKETNYKNIDINYGFVDFSLSGELMKKWNAAIKNSIQLYSNNGSSSTYNNVCIALATEVNKKFAEFNGNSVLKLPLHPRTLEEMKIIRFWLKKLFKCNFHEALFDNYIINPEIIEILFDNKSTKKLQFHTKIANLTYTYYLIHIHQSAHAFQHKNRIENIFNFNVNHLCINQLLSLNFGRYINRPQNDNILLNLFINEGSRIPQIQIKDCSRPIFCNLIINYLETSLNYTNIVPIISFDNLFWRRAELFIRQPQRKFSYGLIINYKEYRCNNIKVLIEFSENMSGTVTRFEIRRT